MGRDLELLIEVDTSLHRWAGHRASRRRRSFGRWPASEACAVAGLLTHAGHAYRCTDPDDLRATAEREGRDLVETAERCADDGIELREISVGSTPTARHVAQIPGVTEIRPGTYVFNDVQQMRLGVATEVDCAARSSRRSYTRGGTVRVGRRRKAFSSKMAVNGPAVPQAEGSSPDGGSSDWTS